MKCKPMPSTLKPKQLGKKAIYTFVVSAILLVYSSSGFTDSLNLPPNLSQQEEETFTPIALRPPPASPDNAQPIATAPPTITPHLTLTLDHYSDTYRDGDKVEFTLQSNKPCYLTLVSVGISGNTIVLFPNKEQLNNYIPAQQLIRFPNQQLLPDMDIKLTYPDEALFEKERLIAFCRTEDAPVFSRPYRFSKYGFIQFSANEAWEKHIMPNENGDEVRTEVSFSIHP